MKQHLKIRKFLGNNDNAIRLQLIAAMIAYALVRIAAKVKGRAPILRFLDLVANACSNGARLAAIEKPPPVNPSRKTRTEYHPIRWSSRYDVFSPDSRALVVKGRHYRVSDDG